MGRSGGGGGVIISVVPPPQSETEGAGLFNATES